MRFLLGLSILSLLSSPLLADTFFSTQIHDIDVGEKLTDVPLVYLSNGRVVKLHSADASILNRLKKAKYEKNWFDVTINADKEIIGIEDAKTPGYQPSQEKFAPHNGDYRPLMEGYIPSIVSEEDAEKLHDDSLRTYAQEETQCFNRAHVWSHEWRIKHQIYSNKMYVFFTKKFIRSHLNFDWWFHVAPMLHVNVNGEVKERMMEIKWGKRKPITIKDWQKIFLRGEPPKCLSILKYSAYANYQEAANCFLMRAPMYYYQPIDLEMHEINGYTKTAWNHIELQQAYKEAFAIDL